MEEVMKGDYGALFIFLYLLPGFVGAVVYDYLIEREPPSGFERIIEALVLTLVSSTVAHLAFRIPLFPDLALNKDTSLTSVLGAFIGTSLMYIALISAAISLVIACMNNHKLLYGLLNATKITFKYGEYDVWKDMFDLKRGYWVKLALKDGRFLIGWPRFYSSSDKPRELFLAEASWWLPNQDGGFDSVDVAGSGVYISDFSQVTAIEVLDGAAASSSKIEGA